MDLSDTEIETLRRAYDTAREALLAERQPEGHWLGRLSPSALSTATAVGALGMVSRERFDGLIGRGLAWLEGHQNADGGWGDSPESPSNVPTTLLAVAAFGIGRPDVRAGDGALARAGAYLAERAGRTPAERIAAVRALYGADRTFAVPILATCALATEAGSPAARELLGVGWPDVPPLPFELACCPRAVFRWLRLHVVSYALPALIAMGQLIHARRPTRSRLWRGVRGAAVGPSLRRLEAIQPSSGGFLEAVPLTSFVLMSLAGAGRAGHPVVQRGLSFLASAARPDGSWPIDANLSTWVTTLAVNALAAGGRDLPEAERTGRWLLDRQHAVRHPFTDSAPGGWGWTHLPGGVPDADDTAGALLALAKLRPTGADVAAARGLAWLLSLQNRDGGWPTFCRGWGRLPFDRSAPDLTAHAVRALAAWSSAEGTGPVQRAVARGLAYLRRAQRPDGGWVPLWFGNQHAPEHENPVYGTARVLLAYRHLGREDCEPALRGLRFLLGAQNADGGWGGARGVASSTEETALAAEALAGWPGDAAAGACRRACLWLARRVGEGGLARPAPIGLYFACLWYSETLYPIIWTVAALGRALPPGEEGAVPGLAPRREAVQARRTP